MSLKCNDSKTRSRNLILFHANDATVKVRGDRAYVCISC